jgi:adenylate kinase
VVDWLTRSLKSNPRSVILDGHLMIETLDGPQLVPDAILKKLPITKVIYIHNEPEIVANRRVGLPLSRSVPEIGDLMAIEERQATRFARQIGAPLSTFSANDVFAFRTALRGS